MKKTLRIALLILSVAVFSACNNEKSTKEPASTPAAEPIEEPAIAPIMEPAVEAKSAEETENIV